MASIGDDAQARAQNVLDRLRALRGSDRNQAYQESSKGDCILACRSMVDLTIRSPFRSTLNNLVPTGSFTFSSTSSSSAPASAKPDTPRGSKLQREEDPLVAIEREVESLFTGTFSEVVSAFTRNLDGIQSTIVEAVAEGAYKACLADCVDDTRRVWPSRLTRCWIDAKTEDDAQRCAKMASDLQRWNELQIEIGRLEKEVKDLSG
ncbi:hypothetical protein DFJ74DRAFT_648833 [Hyaloraphidium curvatum]|nr:hypothetical protein DFJ74DRAFT_648833 [Hyaloraphidium curvatum]